MPSSRRLKVTGLVALLTVCIIFYVTNGARSTHDSAFYTRTVGAIKDRQDNEARRNALAEERERLARVERLHREHDVAVSAAAAEETRSVNIGPNQKPMVPQAGSKPGAGAKSVAGRKMMSDGKVVHGSPAEDVDDGVAKVGNIGPQASHAIVGDKDEPEEDHKVQDALNEILKKGPIIIFSKSYCPFSKKAKNILLNLYDITPPPYVVELDQHELGSGLQSTLERMTGRRTVPNILINGRSIGGGDDIEDLHNDGKMVSTISSMGGKRIMKVEKKTEAAADKKSEMKFKA